MFTGIITQVGTLTHIAPCPPLPPEGEGKGSYLSAKASAKAEASAGGGGVRLTIGAEWKDTPPLGASIACNGVCLTVIAADNNSFAVEATPETLRLTTLGSWKKGARINLERALRTGDELGGHFVSGHVDGLAKIVEIKEEGNSMRITLEAPLPLHRYIAIKGSVALDGISLTVTSVENNRFSVTLIPHTRAVTTAGEWKKGSQVNLEIDPLARYALRLMETR